MKFLPTIINADFFLPIRHFPMFFFLECGRATNIFMSCLVWLAALYCMFVGEGRLYFVIFEAGLEPLQLAFSGRSVCLNVCM